MDDAVTVMLVGLEARLADELTDDERFDVRSADSLDELEAGEALDALTIAGMAAGLRERLAARGVVGST